jgi:Zn-dependent peptidase ImmA (M78 family)
MPPLDRAALAANVRAAIDASGRQQQDVATAIGISPSALSRALSGQRDLKSLELALIAEALEISVEALLDPTKSSARLGMAARADVTASPAVDEALARLALLGDLAQFLESVGRSAPEYTQLVPPYGLPPHLQGAELARKVRESIGLANAHLPTELDALIELLERSLAIDIAVEPLPSGLDGLSAKQGNSRFILLNSRVASTRLRWTLAHEIGHLESGDCDGVTLDEDIWRSKSPEETRANGFAAEFLVPSSLLAKETSGRQITEDLVGYLLGQFRISLDALAYRLHNSGIVNAAGRDAVRSMSSASIAFRYGRMEDLQKRLDRHVPSRMLRELFDLFYRGQASIRPLANLLNVEAEQLLDELSSYQARGDQPSDAVDGMPVR